jgi:isoleucyl-tRNA synthetase
MDFNTIEMEIISYWKEIDMMRCIDMKNKDGEKWEFLDGPPFVNGTPHMGHLLVSAIKDCFARYYMMRGYKVDHTIGFDCHGLPLEQEAEKVVGKVSSSDSMEKLQQFNDTCRSIISNCSDIWYDVLGRMGRMIDKDLTYHTSNPQYMESLWWAFKQLWDKNLIYRSKKVMPYSPLCETPLSNFEATSNYIERTDISVYVRFKIKNTNEYMLAWTTTPWSLFANQGIGVNSTLEYDLVQVNNMESYWVEKYCVANVFKDTQYTVLCTKLGQELVGLEYEPIFNIHNYNNYKIYGAMYISAVTGTGVVHLAPMFGAEDMKVMKENGYTDNLLPVHIVDSMVRFTFNHDHINTMGRFVIDTSTDVVVWLKKNGHAYRSEKIKHSYPHCWRTDSPLIYMATDAWFMNVRQIIPDLVDNNAKISWSPSYVGTERFANWIKDSPDWCLSRNRVWGTPIPVWVNTMDSSDMLCIGSIEELAQYTEKDTSYYTDLHIDRLDCKGCAPFTYNGKTYTRTFGVLDCWFESGMAGISRFGYPMCKQVSYPVDFIAESVDQTRGWFYTLNVLSTALYNTMAFKKVNVSGLILAADGKKMSKRLQNYTTPDLLIKKYGADILRLYLVGSPAAKAESFCFKDSDLAEIGRKILPYYNAHILLLDCIKTSQEVVNYNMTYISTNKLDLWICEKYMEFAQSMVTCVENVDITHIPNTIYRFIDVICNTYIKLSRDRLKNMLTPNDTYDAINTLQNILHKTNILLAPFIPHLAEYFNRILKLKNEQPILLHSIDIDMIQSYELNRKILDGFESVSELLENVRNLRQQVAKPNYYPLDTINLYIDNMNIMEYQDVVCRELNARKLVTCDITMLPRKYQANKMLVGKKYKKEANNIVTQIENGDVDGIDEELYSYQYMVDIKKEDNMIGTSFNYRENYSINKQAIVTIDKNRTKENDMEAEINNIRRNINAMRKDMGLKMYNKITIYFQNNEFWNNINVIYMETLSSRLSANIMFVDRLEKSMEIVTHNGTKILCEIKIHTQNQDTSF